MAAQVTLAWETPTLDVNGNPLTDLAGYRIYYGTNSHDYSTSIPVGETNAFTITNLSPSATYFVSITALNSEGGESSTAGEMSWSAGDADDDGMSDEWESAYLAGYPASLALFDADADGDGLSNLDEYIGGSNPTVVDAATLLDAVCANGQICILFDAREASGTGYTGKDRYYSIEHCTNAASGVWIPVPGYASIHATNQTVTYAANGSTGPALVRTRMWLE
jgi:hypothetical protein